MLTETAERCMDGIRVNFGDGDAIHEWLQGQHTGSSKGPRERSLDDGVSLDGGHPRPVPPKVPPDCGAPGRKSLGGSDSGQAGGLPFTGQRCREDAETAFEEGKDQPKDPDLPPPCGVPGRKSRGHSDPGQAARPLSPPCLRKEQVETDDNFVLFSPRGCLDKGAGGGNEPPGNDQAQAEGHEGLQLLEVMQEAPEHCSPYTGRFHPLLWEECHLTEGQGLRKATDPAKSPQDSDAGPDQGRYSAGPILQAAYGGADAGLAWGWAKSGRGSIKAAWSRGLE